MREILDKKSDLEEMAVNAIIDGDYIIPGLNGKIVLEKESYYKMKNNNSFSEDSIVYKEVSPTISIKDNIKYIIKNGNYKKNAVSFLVDSNYEVIIYLNENNIIYSNINNLSHDLCYLSKNNSLECMNDNRYIFTHSYKLSNNFIDYKVNSGDIIFISNDMTLNNFKYFLKMVYYNDLKVISINEMISEKANY